MLRFAEPPHPVECSLSELPRQRRAKIVALRMPETDAAWLEAVGLSRGDELQVLRQAPFGGPLHVRTANGPELALDRKLASRIQVTAVPLSPVVGG